jgi:protoporphyrinogen/coproporphyrinogen III oxidase
VAVDTDVLVVGGGISGLSTAWMLARAGAHTTLWERESVAGGLIRTDSANGYRMERAASMVMNFRPDVDQFLSEAGLDNLKIRRDALAEENRYVLQRNQLITVPGKLGSVPLSKVWSLRGKLRMALEPFIRKGGHDGETVSEFIRRRLGDELLETAMEPFVAGNLASDPDRANACAVLPRLTALEKRYGSIVKGVIVNKLHNRRTAMVSDSFSFKQGMSTLVKRLSSTLAMAGNARIDHQFTVTGIERQGDNWAVYARSPKGSHSICARHVVLSTPAPAAAELANVIDPVLGDLLAGIDYAPLTLVHLGFDRSSVSHPLDGTGFLTPRGAGLSVTGNLWMSSLFPDRSPADKVLLTSYQGGARLPEAASWGDQRSVDAVLAQIGPLLKIKDAPEHVHIHRHPQALPLYHGNYYNRCTAIEQRLQQLTGLHLQANYLGGVSIRDRLATSRLTADQIIADLGLSAHPGSDANLPAGKVWATNQP